MQDRIYKMASVTGKWHFYTFRWHLWGSRCTYSTHYAKKNPHIMNFILLLYQNLLWLLIFSTVGSTAVRKHGPQLTNQSMVQPSPIAVCCEQWPKKCNRKYGKSVLCTVAGLSLELLLLRVEKSDLRCLCSWSGLYFSAAQRMPQYSLELVEGERSVWTLGLPRLVN